MENINEFKKFVRKYPILIDYVNNKEKTWQQFYEMWYLYKEDYNVWSKYINKQNAENNDKNNFNFTSFIENIKKIDMKILQDNISSINKGLSLLEQLVKKDKNKEEYKPRPVYKRFED